MTFESRSVHLASTVAIAVAMCLLASCSKGEWNFFSSTSLDDSPDAMKGRWNVQQRKWRKENCGVHRDLDARTFAAVDVDVVETNADDQDEKKTWLDVSGCMPDGDCIPSVRRYSRFEKTSALGWILETEEANAPDYPRCRVTVVDASLAPASDSTVTLHYTIRRGIVLLEGNETCDEELARQRADTYECVETLHLTAKRSPNAS